MLRAGVKPASAEFAQAAHGTGAARAQPGAAKSGAGGAGGASGVAGAGGASGVRAGATKAAGATGAESGAPTMSGGGGGGASALREPLAVIPTPDTTPEAQREADRAAEAAFLARLAEEPWAHDFFAAVRRAEAVRSDVPGVGRSSRADEDPFRFAQEPSLAFSPCNLSEFKAATGTAPARLFVSFMGLLGPNGPMPLHVTDYARERQIHHKDHTLARFLDVFNHRMVSLFYRAWAASQMTVSFDRWEPGASTALDSVTRELALARDTDRYATYIGSLFGLGMDSLRHRDGVQDLAKLHFSGRLSNQVKNPEGVRSILRDYLGVDVEIEEFLGRWTDVPPEYHMSLGRMPPAGRGAGCIGATGGVMGTRVFDCGSAFRLRLGPMSLEHYQRMLPGTRTARRIDAWIRTYLGDEFWWEAVLILRRDEVPKARLGAGTRLGWTSWIHSGAAEEDRADLALRSPR